MSSSAVVFKRRQTGILAARLAERRRFMQIVAGARQSARPPRFDRCWMRSPYAVYLLPLKYAGKLVRQRGSSPKLQVLNTALMTWPPVANAKRSIGANATMRSISWSVPGLGAFAQAFNPTRTLLVGGDGVPVEEFLTQPVEYWLQA